jgi:membrane associated rhomboid family serine protease
MRAPKVPETKKRSTVLYLLLGTIAIYLLQQILNVFFPGPAIYRYENRLLYNWFALSSTHFQELKVWSILSYAFLHSTQNMWHLIGNMAGLFFIGRTIEPILGREKFLMLYLGGALAGGALYLVLHFNSGTIVVGASAAVFAIMAYFCLKFPERPITLLLFFVLPVTVKPKYLLKFLAGLSLAGLLFFELRDGPTSIAHSAHLGGLAFGFIFFRFADSWNLEKLFIRQKSGVEPPNWFKKNKKLNPTGSYTVNRTKKDPLDNELDRILDKINDHGFGSLNEAEQKTLQRAKGKFH